MRLRPRLRETITRAPVTARNSFGEPQYGPQEALRARVQRKHTLVLSAEGVERQSDTRIFTDSPLNLDDRIWLPGDSPSNLDSARKPISVMEMRDLVGRVVFYVSYF